MVFTVILTLFLATAPCFAEGLKLVNNYPEEGSKTSPPTNLGIKLFFDNNVTALELREQNESYFKLWDDEGKSVPLEILYTETDPNYILAIAEPEDAKQGLGSDREYRFEIAQELQAIDGSTLDAPEFITFRTRNTSRDMNINMALMGVMVVGMLAFSTISMRRQAKKTAASEVKDQKVNPYRVAKETGKSVSEVIAQEEKKKKKSAKKSASSAGKDAAKKPTEASASADGRRVKRVKGPRPISAAGSSYKTGRKAAAEEKARKEAARLAKGTTKPKNKSTKSSSTKSSTAKSGTKSKNKK
jgi:hypothetical protein